MIRMIFLLGVALIACTPAISKNDAACLTFDKSASSELKNYFLEVALGSEFGGNQRIHKWQESLRVSLEGQVSDVDRKELEAIVAELNGLLGAGFMNIVSQNPNVRIVFEDVNRFTDYLDEYVEGNEGFFWFYWNAQGDLFDAIVLINKDQEELYRRHLLREELTQVLGLATDSQTYPESIFYQPWTDVTTYSNEDRAVIKMLYSCEIKSNMTLEQVRRLF